LGEALAAGPAGSASRGVAGGGAEVAEAAVATYAAAGARTTGS
jgi:hypothetical protein